MTSKLFKQEKLLVIIILVFLSYSPTLVKASGASLYFSPNNGTFFVGSTFDVSVFVNTNQNNINAVRVDLKFDPKKLQIANPTTGRSFISVWIAQPSYSNIDGVASFQGGVPSPGINTTSGLVSTITFRAIAPGETFIDFSQTSKILLNDGQGSNILNSTSRGSYKLEIPPPEGPQVFSPTHLDQNKWYKNNNPTFSWVKDAGVTDFSYVLDNDFSSVPDNTSEGAQTSISYTDLQDGIWYFHIKAKNDGAWGGTSNYLVQIDASPPASFNIDFEPKLKSPVTTSREPIVSFITTDAFSGIGHYELKVVDFTKAKNKSADFFVEVVSPYKLPTLNIGENQIIVRAFDVAGNWQDSSQKIEVIPTDKILYLTKRGINIWVIFFPWWQIILCIIILIIIILTIIISGWWREKKLNEKRKELENIKENAQKNTWINIK